MFLVCSDGENETKQSFSINVIQIEEFKNPVVTIISIIIAIILLLILMCILIIVYCSSHRSIKFVQNVESPWKLDSIDTEEQNVIETVGDYVMTTS